jgi:hypothetical protein
MSDSNSMSKPRRLIDFQSGVSAYSGVSTRSRICYCTCGTAILVRDHYRFDHSEWERCYYDPEHEDHELQRCPHCNTEIAGTVLFRTCTTPLN